MGQTISSSSDNIVIPIEDVEVTPLYEWDFGIFKCFLNHKQIPSHVIEAFKKENKYLQVLCVRHKSLGETLYYISSSKTIAYITNETQYAKQIFKLIQEIKQNQIKTGIISEEKKKELDFDQLRLWDLVFDLNIPQNYQILNFKDDIDLMKDIVGDDSLNDLNNNDNQQEDSSSFFQSTNNYAISNRTSASNSFVFNLSAFPEDVLSESEKKAISNCLKKLDSAMKDFSKNLIICTAQNFALPDRYKYKFFHPGLKRKMDDVSSVMEVRKPSSSKKPSLPIKLVITALSDTQYHRLVRRFSHFTKIATNEEKGGFGMFHTALVIGNNYLEWNDNSLACVRSISSSRAIFVCQLKSFPESEIDNAISKVCKVCCLWNANHLYDVNKHNCQHFTLAVLKALNIDINKCLPEPIKDYFMNLKQYGTSDMVYKIPKELRTIFNFEKITFKTHRELDEFWLTVSTKFPSWVSTPIGQSNEALLKGFDRAFWLRKLSSKEGYNEANEPLRNNEDKSRCLCPFNVYESETHCFYLADTVMGGINLGSWEPLLPRRQQFK
ncbi:hypothetical protein ABK040_000626 [Willaertia magna]